jgi:hypothetical protein
MCYNFVGYKMKFIYRYISILLLTALLYAPAKGQTLEGVCDSIFEALRYEEFDSLKQFFPSYRDLKTTFDSMDIDKQAQQILIAQKSGEYALKRSFKSFKKEAGNLKMPLDKMEKVSMRHKIQTYEGKQFSIAEVECQYRNRGATIYYTVIELNNVWYLGEDFRIEKREVEMEPDFEKIDRDAERRREKREKAKIEAREKAVQDSAKAMQDSAKVVKQKQLDAAKKEKEEAKKQRAEEKAKKKADIAAEKRRKKEELERKKKEKAEKLKHPPAKIQPKDTVAPQDSVPKN